MIEHADCLHFLGKHDNDTIDLLLIDPPYFEIVKDSWDHQWDTENEYLDWCLAWTRECVRVLKPGRCMYVWGTTKTDTFLRYKLEVLNQSPEMVYQNWIIWGYDWGGRTNKTFGRKHEDLLMYSKGAEFLFNADAVRIPYIMKKNVRDDVEQNPLGKIPTDVWLKNNHTTSKEHVSWHVTQKPLELLERIILANTAKNDTVMDIFSGSGSTAIACDNTGRKFTGCEVHEEYYLMSQQRRQEWQMMVPPPLPDHPCIQLPNS